MFSALQGAMSNDSVRQLTQVFANCNQALDHRGFVDLNNQPLVQKNGAITNLSGNGLPPWATGGRIGNGNTYPFNSLYGGNYYGTDGAGGTLQDTYRTGGDGVARWSNANPADYNGGGPFVMPPPGGGYTSGDWITYMGDQNYFDLAPRVTETVNQYYGGPSFQVAGDSYYDNTVTNNSYVTNMTVNNITVQEINGNPVGGEQGDPGIAGPGGAPGGPGAPGAAGPAGANGFNGFNGINGLNGAQGLQGQRGADGINQVVFVGAAQGAKGDRGDPGVGGGPDNTARDWVNLLRQYVNVACNQRINTIMQTLRRLRVTSEFDPVKCKVNSILELNPNPTEPLGAPLADDSRRDRAPFD